MSGPMPENETARRAETYATFAEIAAEGPLPDVADIDYALTAKDHADWDAAEAALAEAGYLCARMTDDDGTPYLAARLEDQPVTALAVWLGEEAAAQAAHPHGFTPDGWGFLA